MPGGLAACSRPPSGSGETKVKSLVIAYPDVPGVLDGDQSDNSMSEEVQQNTHGGDILRYKLVKSDDGLWMEDIGAPGFTGLEDALAESWEASEDLKTYTFKLRKDIKSVYGNPLIADDVIWSWQKRYFMNTSSVGFGIAAGVTSADQVKKIDDHTVVFELPSANNIFPKVDAVFHAGGLVDSVETKKHVTADDPWALKYLASTMGGFGAYVVESVKKGQEIVFRSNPNYFRGQPHFDKVTWRGVPKSSERLAMLVRGDVDVATSLSARELAEVSKNPNLQVASFVSNHELHLRVNNKEAPFSDVRVRQALAYAMPVQQIIDSVYNGKARPMKSQLSELVQGYTDEYWVYDRNVAKAKQLLADAGATKLSFEVIYDTSVPEHQDVGVIMKTAFAEVGVTIDLTGLPAANYADRRGARKFQGAIGENYPYLVDPAYTIQLFFVSDHGANWANYSNPEYDKIAKGLPAVVDEKQRLEMIRRAQEIWEHDQPWIMICNPGFHIAHRKGLSGFVWGGDNTIRYEKLTDA